jgi:hypothetical protein
MALVNIVFVHGLGGSLSTWTHPKSKWFWPAGLAGDLRFENARILTFEYDSLIGLHRGDPGTTLGITDFGRQLLLHLHLVYDQRGNVHP